MNCVTDSKHSRHVGRCRGADDVLNAAQRDAQTVPPMKGPTPTVTTCRSSTTIFRSSRSRTARPAAPALGIVRRVRGHRGAGRCRCARNHRDVRQRGSRFTRRRRAPARRCREHKDALAAVDVLVPSEVRSMRETVKHADGTRRRAASIVDEASKPLEGVDLSVDHLALRTEPLADGYAKVSSPAARSRRVPTEASCRHFSRRRPRNGEDGQGIGRT